MAMEFKLARLDAKAATEEGVFVGYASRFNVVDQGGDMVRPGAYAKSIAGQKSVKLLWQHDAAQPIGVWTSISEDEKGLRVEGRLALETVKGRETHALMKMGAIEGLSIGYRTKDADIIDGIRHLKEIDLWEISVVTFPMEDGSGVDAVKSSAQIMRAAKDGDFAPLKKSVEVALRDAGLPVWLRKAVAARAPEALGDGQRDASASETAKAIKDAFKF